MWSNGHGMIGHQLCQGCGTLCKTVRKVFKVSDLIDHAWRQADATFIGIFNFVLKKTEQPPRTRYTNRHAAQLSEYLMPRRQCNPGSSPQVIKDLSQTLLSVCRKFQGLTDRVHQPTKDDLKGRRVTVSFKQLLGGRDMFSVWGIGFVNGAKDAVDRMQ